jgi:rod shape-determining protein MreD
MKYLLYCFTIFVLFILTVVLQPLFSIYGTFPNLLLLFVLILAIFKDKDYSFLFVAFFSGLFLDSYYGSLFGGYMFCFLLLSLGFHILSNYFFSIGLSLKSWAPFIFGSVILFYFIFWVYSNLLVFLNLEDFTLNMQGNFISILIEALYSWFVSYLIYKLVEYLKYVNLKYLSTKKF